MCGMKEGWPVEVPPMCGGCAMPKMWHQFYASVDFRVVGWACTACDLVTVTVGLGPE